MLPDNLKQMFASMGWGENSRTPGWNSDLIEIRDANNPGKILYFVHRQILNDLAERFKKMTTAENGCGENNTEKDWDAFQMMVSNYVDFMDMIIRNNGYYNNTDKSIADQFKNYFQQFASKK